ncbi:hypothetical protein MAC_01741 [Metarhizium acridum CQMa 102]|uniref:Uncharacterized protein n=1 Tax=Metarhizium acridum (strain CQMa 102) TaxID=655827 RepID=E9DVU3_METAQ|nr:uncharacterized protein MAC_01741 [Metarhizium acridum CQMa 102]EFY92140.1 hypothetical protein MAC_01741 [Metarhizium acridum CQMa 102]
MGIPFPAHQERTCGYFSWASPLGSSSNELVGKASHRTSQDETAPDDICVPSPDMSYRFGTNGTQNTNSMDTGVNQVGLDDESTGFIPIMLDDKSTGFIPIGLEQGQARHPRLPPQPGPPPARPLPPAPTSRTRRTPKNAQNPASQAQTIPGVAEGPVTDVLTTGFYQVMGDISTWTEIYHFAGQKGIDGTTGEYYTTLVAALEDALESENLSEEQENEVFDYLGWPFFCETCKKVKHACEFSSCCREFWDEKLGGLVFLHGECGPCEDKRLRAALESRANTRSRARPTRRRA